MLIYVYSRYVVWKYQGTPAIIGLTLTVGALPAVIFLIFAEIIVDYCGHNNLLIVCFVNYIIHHSGVYKYFYKVTHNIFRIDYVILKSTTLHVSVKPICL